MTWKIVPKKAIGEHAAVGLKAAIGEYNTGWNNSENSSMQKVRARIALRNAWQDEDYSKIKVYSLSKRWLVVLTNAN